MSRFFVGLVGVTCLVSVDGQAGLKSGRPAPEIDLLALAPGQTLGSAWQYVSEDTQSKLEDVWTLRDGVLICRGSPKGYIATRSEYTDFVLRLEWRWPEGKKPGRGGVLVRTTGPDKIWPRSLEAQVNAGDVGDFWGLNGYPLRGQEDRMRTLDHPQFGRLTHVKKFVDAERPAGQWNQYCIKVQGDKATLELNGRVVNEASGCLIAPGRICLTAEGDEIHFRNVKLFPLDKPR